jgi:hypothetical protein
MFYLIKPFINYAIVFAFHPRLEWKVVKILVFSTLLTVQIFTFRSLKKAYNEE